MGLRSRPARSNFLAATYAAVLVMVLALTASPARAAETQPARTALSDALVAAYAELNGVTDVVAEERIWQEELINDALGLLAEEHGETTFDAWLDDAAGELVLFARTADPLLLDALSEAAEIAGLPLQVDENDPVVAARTDVASDRVDELLAEIPDLAGFYVDPVDGALVLDIAAANGGDAAAQATLITGLETRITLVGAAGDNDPVHGGVTMSNCTLGFMATYASGSTTYQGFVTAAHCGTSVRYYYNTGGTGNLRSATYRTRTWNGNADIAFHSVASGDTAGTRFYGSSATATTDQGSVTTAAKGTTVCRRGKVIGYDCGKVSTTTYTPTWTNACNGFKCNAVFVRTPQKANAGDSGGPVWTGTSRPVGIHKGGSAGTVFGVGQYSVYSKIGYKPTGVLLK